MVIFVIYLIIITIDVFDVLVVVSKPITAGDKPKYKEDIKVDPAEEEIQYWYQDARKVIANKKKLQLNKHIAKNVILFMGDGMSMATIKAARIYAGRQAGVDGERTKLAMDSFPFSGLVKTFCLDMHIPDSACTGTAYLKGTMGNYGTIGVGGMVDRFDCEASKIKKNRADSIATWSQSVGKRTGFVTTSTVTDASPAGLYAHSASRNWESDLRMTGDDCKDIAYQLIHGKTGKKLNVILGGGRANLLPESKVSHDGFSGNRQDERDLIEEWLDEKKNKRAGYVWNKTALFDAARKKKQYLLGMFDSGSMPFYLDDEEHVNPTLEEMTEAAIKVLSGGKKGYFLFVEGGLIDRAHHQSLVRIALAETVELSKAIKKARDMTDEKDTLIVVTSDHSQALCMSGPAHREDDILDLSLRYGQDDVPYSVLAYANGPGYRPPQKNTRYDISNEDKEDINLKYPAMVPLTHSTHAGEDVPVYASGPWAHLFSGVIEQHLIAHIMAFASCVGNGEKACNEKH